MICTRALLLAVLMLWFATHHLAPGFEQRIFGLGLHAHPVECCESTQVTQAHTHSDHCEFCGSAGFMVQTFDNILPRAPHTVVYHQESSVFITTRIVMTRLARAPPMGV